MSILTSLEAWSNKLEFSTFSIFLQFFWPVKRVNNSVTMRLDITMLRYLTREDWRVLIAIEQGMKVSFFFLFFSSPPLLSHATC